MSIRQMNASLHTALIWLTRIISPRSVNKKSTVLSKEVPSVLGSRVLHLRLRLSLVKTAVNMLLKDVFFLNIVLHARASYTGRGTVPRLATPMQMLQHRVSSATLAIWPNWPITHVGVAHTL